MGFAEAASCIVHCKGRPADHPPTMLRVDRVNPESRHPPDNGTGEHSEKWSLDRVSCVSVHRSVSDRARRHRIAVEGSGRIHRGIGGEHG